MEYIISNDPFLEKVTHGTKQFPFQIYYVSYIEELPHFALNNTDYPYMALPIHLHKEYEIMMVKDNEFDFSIDQKHYIAKKGDIINVPSYHLHSGSAKTPSINYVGFVFNLSLLAQAAYDDIQEKYIQPIYSHIVYPKILIDTNQACNSKLNNILNSILEIYEKKELGFELLIKSYLLQYLGLLFSNELIYSNVIKPEKLHSDRLLSKKAIEFIQQRYKDNIRLEDLANELSISKFYCCRFFKEHFGSTFIDYLNNHRINLAINLLKKNIYTISEISDLVGFSSQSYFNTVYKKYTGHSPSNFQKNV